jgi:hypothetical protein
MNAKVARGAKGTQTPIRTAVFSRRGAEARRSFRCAMRRDASAFPSCGSSGFPTVPIPISIHFSQRTQRAQRSLCDSPGGSICVHLRHLRLKIRNFQSRNPILRSDQRKRLKGNKRNSNADPNFLGGRADLIHPRLEGVGGWGDGRLGFELRLGLRWGSPKKAQ